MIPKRYELLTFGFLMSMFMSWLMSFVITLINLGFVDGFFMLWMAAFIKAWFVAFPTVVVVVPQVRKIVKLLVKEQ